MKERISSRTEGLCINVQQPESRDVPHAIWTVVSDGTAMRWQAPLIQVWHKAAQTLCRQKQHVSASPPIRALRTYPIGPNCFNFYFKRGKAMSEVIDTKNGSSIYQQPPPSQQPFIQSSTPYYIIIITVVTTPVPSSLTHTPVSPLQSLSIVQWTLLSPKSTAQ
jgi:hypothetical protein